MVLYLMVGNSKQNVSPNVRGVAIGVEGTILIKKII